MLISFSVYYMKSCEEQVIHNIQRKLALIQVGKKSLKGAKDARATGPKVSRKCLLWVHSHFRLPNVERQSHYFLLSAPQFAKIYEYG